MKNHKSFPAILVSLLFVNWSMQDVTFLVASLTLLAFGFLAGLRFFPESISKITNTSIGYIIAMVFMVASVLLSLVRRGAFN